MIRLTAIPICVALGCASNRAATPLRLKGEPGQPLYVGHSDTGEVVVAANHFDAMRGLAVSSSDVGGSGDALLVCSREVLTGTHLPHWICRHPKEVDEDRASSQRYLLQPRNCVDCHP